MILLSRDPRADGEGEADDGAGGDGNVLFGSAP